MNKGKDPIIVQDCQSFVDAARHLIFSTKIIHIDETALIQYKDSNPFENVIEAKGILKMHVIEVDGKNTRMWRNCKFQEYSEPDFVIERKNNNYV